MTELLSAPLGALVIFLLRILDVSLGTFRIVLGVRGFRVQAALIGFVEIFIWLVAIGTALDHLTSPLHILGYAGGFAAGSFVGLWVDEQVGLGLSVVRAVCPRSADPSEGGAPAEALREAGFAVTEVDGRGRDAPVDILNVVARRRQVPEVIDLVHANDADAFVTVEEVRSTRGGFFQRTPSTASLRPAR